MLILRAGQSRLVQASSAGRGALQAHHGPALILHRWLRTTSCRSLPLSFLRGLLLPSAAPGEIFLSLTAEQIPFHATIAPLPIVLLPASASATTVQNPSPVLLGNNRPQKPLRARLPEPAPQGSSKSTPRGNAALRRRPLLGCHSAPWGLQPLLGLVLRRSSDKPVARAR